MERRTEKDQEQGTNRDETLAFLLRGFNREGVPASGLSKPKRPLY